MCLQGSLTNKFGENMKLIDGKTLAKNIREGLRIKIANEGKEIGLAVVIVGEDAASQIYVRNKIKACEELGIRSYSYALPTETSQTDLERLLDELGKDDRVHGILLQMPLPKHLDGESAMEHIPVSKDVDGFSAENLGRLFLKRDCMVSCTPQGVMEMFKSEKISLSGKKAVVVGRSDTVGKPMAALLLNADATVTICHSKTENLKEICASADILIAAVGKAKFVKADMVKEGAVVIDVGMNRDENGKLCGDVDFENVKEKTSFITPVPGGVGPMTIAMLMRNTYLSAQKERKD